LQFEKKNIYIDPNRINKGTLLTHFAHFFFMSQTWNAFRAEQASKGLTIAQISSKYRAMKAKAAVVTRKSGVRSKNLETSQTMRR